MAEGGSSKTAIPEEIEEREERGDEPHSIFEVGHRPERTQVASGDVKFCPECGEDVPPENTEFVEDLVLNRYRTEFKCGDCGYHGEVFRHE
jgi:ribosomal protein S27AE